MRTKLLVSAAAAVASLAFSASASATTFHSSPDSSRTQAPCTVEAPCKLSFALGQAFDGDDVALFPGTYDHHASDPLEVRPGVVLHGSSGVRPLIEQSAPYRDCDGCPVLELRSGAILRDVDVTQVEGGGAVKAVADATIERAALRGRSVALTFAPSAPSGTPGGVRNVLAVAEDGIAILSRGGGPTRYLENVTAIGRGGLGVGLSVRSSGSTDETVDAVNTIARGDFLDAEAYAEPSAGFEDVATLKLRYSNFRTDRIQQRESDPAWSNAQIETFDHNQHDDPRFAGANDFHLSETSPAIDSGRTAGLNGSLDLDGRPRAFGAKPDIGAYEWQPPEVSDEDPPPATNHGCVPDCQPHPPQQPEPQQPPNGHEFQSPFRGLALASQTVVVKRNVAIIAGNCDPRATANACAGTLELKVGKVKVGKARYQVAAGKRATIRVKLTSGARKLIARKRKLKVTATATPTFGSGLAVKAPVTLKLPAKRRR